MNYKLKTRMKHKQEKLTGVVMKRRFLGKTENFDNKLEKTFYERMLRAYLKGHTYFHFGITVLANGYRMPKITKVAQEYYSENYGKR